MKVLFACGGTAGHVNPAVGVAGRLKELLPDSEFLFIGAEGKMETELVPREGYEIRTIKISNLSRSLSAEGCDNSFGFFKLDDIHYIFNAQRLEIELVGSGVIR